MGGLSESRSGRLGSKPPTVLVLTPSVGGDFFGNLLSGLMRAVVAANGRLIVVETRQKASARDEAGTQGDFAVPVGWSNVDGVISITTAVGKDYVVRAHAAGKPVVLVSSTQLEDLPAPLVRPDNRTGADLAVDHLVEHGHTRIGFVGNLAQHDIRERCEGLQAALERHGLVFDPRLVYNAPHNAEAGGAQAAQALVGSEVRPTAVLVATDRNAIGFIDTLREAGMGVPRDVATVSFDNAMAATFETPTLTSVELRFDRVGALAAHTLLSAIDGKDITDGTLSPEVAQLILRESCGCAAQTRYSDDLHSATGHSEADIQLLQRNLTDVLEMELCTGEREADQRASAIIAATVRDTVSLLELGDGATTARLRSFTTSLLAIASQPDTVRRVVDAITAHVFRVNSRKAPDARGSEGMPMKLADALSKAQSAALIRHAHGTDKEVAGQYAVDAGLLTSAGSDPRDLTWLAGTGVKAGVLGLWSGRSPGKTLTVVGEYRRNGAPLGAVDNELPSEGFPPKVFADLASPVQREVCVVLPVVTPENNWGMLAVVVPIDPSVERDTHQHWAAMLGVALESQRRQEAVRRSALYDSLTGLANRQLFREHLEHAIDRRAKNGTPFSVLFLDLDDFKLINDSLGHQIGDRVLQKVATELSGTLRAVDIAARFGGDEFVILLTETEPEAAKVAAQRIQEVLNNTYVFDGHEIAIPASIGIASSAVNYTSADDVLRDADAAMYRAKSAEPGTIEYFDAPMHQSATRRAAMVKDVVAALRQDQFEVHYQPIVDLSTGRTDRFEALVRWCHPERGLLESDDFLKDIEETSLIIQLGQHVLDTVCRHLAEWGPRVANVSINISDTEFWSQNLLTRVLASLEKYGLSPERLTLEVTERVLVRRPELALRITNRLHEAGLKLHIDNFGAGHSSLETLERFPVDAFKIDRAFIQSLTGAQNSAEVISALVRLGRAMGLSVVAGGVETEEQRLFLQELGCATGQGRLFMPAVTGERVGELLDRTLHRGEGG